MDLENGKSVAETAYKCLWDGQEFLLAMPTAPVGATGASGASAPAGPTITLGDLKHRIAAVNAELNAGDGTREYEECIKYKYQIEREDRYFIAEGEGRRVYVTHPTHEFDSGQPADTTIYEDEVASAESTEKKSKLWFDGRDSALLDVVTGDLVPGAYVSTITQTVVSARPIPAGEYKVNNNYLLLPFIPCNHVFTYEMTVTVTAPEGTVHEAFFDPVVIGAAVGADGSRGVLKPASFAIEGVGTTDIKRIRWESASVEMQIDPPGRPTGHHIDFIALDGTVVLRLDFDDAVDVVEEGRTRALTWGVCERSWNDGDLLMLRISESPPGLTGATNDVLCPPPPPQNLTASSTQDSVTLTWEVADDPTVTGYLVLRRIARQDTFSKFEVTNGTATTYVDTTDIESGTNPHTQSPNSVNAIIKPRIEYFAVDNTGPAGATIRFEIIGARPPKSREIVHKVGRTSGWTSGRVENHGDFDDPTCPGNHTLRGNVIGSGYAIECLIDAGYRSRGGDSGSPVFVMVDDSTTDNIEVILVGVHYGGTDATATGAFVPIDRVYAESLLNGYDWSTDTQEVRPIPALDSDMETLTVLDDGPKIRAEFLIEDFSPGLGLKYEAQLFRSSGTSAPTPVRIGGSEAVRTVSRTNRVAEFDLSDLDVNQRSGSFSVKIKFCVYDLAANPNALWCGEHGSDGGKSVTPVPAPTSLSVTRETDGDVLVSWGAVASVSEYKISYRPSLSSDPWVEIGGDRLTTTAASVSNLQCGASASYEFRVRALADASVTNNPYDGTWGFWSGTSSSILVRCTGASGSAEKVPYATEVASPDDSS